MVAETERRIELMNGAQWDFVVNEALHPAFITGRGAGKTVASVVKAFAYAMGHPGARGVQTSPTYQMAKDIVIPEMQHHFGETRRKVWDVTGGNEPKVQFANGSEIFVRPALDPDRLRGLNLAFFGMDEVTVGDQQEAFLILQAAIRQEGYPAQGWVTGTPKGVRHWTYFRWGKHQLPSGALLPRDDYPVFWADSRYNPHLPPEFVENLLRSYGEGTAYARQELEGQFVEMSGMVYPHFSPEVHVQPRPLEMTVKRRLTGVDFGVRQPTSAVHVEVDAGGRSWAVREYYKRESDLRQLAAELGSWPPARLICDPQGKLEIDALRKAGFAARKARSSEITSRVNSISSRLAGNPPGLLVTPECPNLIEELATLAYYKPKGMDLLSDRFEQGLPDHAHDALANVMMELAVSGGGNPPSASIRYKGW